MRHFEVVRFPPGLAKVVGVFNFAFTSTRFQRLNAMIYVGKETPTGLAGFGG
jgi:hypothetical protein